MDLSLVIKLVRFVICVYRESRNTVFRSWNPIPFVFESEESADIEPENPPLRARKSGPLTQIKGGFSRSQKIDRGFTSKSDPKIWPARQIKGGFSRSPAGRGGVSGSIWADCCS